MVCLFLSLLIIFISSWAASSFTSAPSIDANHSRRSAFGIDAAFWRGGDFTSIVLPNSRAGSSLFSTIKDNATKNVCDAVETTDETEKNPVKSAGLSFVSASTKSLGMLFYNIGGMDHKDIQALLLQAGTRLVAAGEAWESDWDTVRDSTSGAAQAFYDISDVFGSANIDESAALGTLFENIGRELEEVSDISGCCAVGPPCSVPNLLAVEENLTEVSKILKKNSVAATDEHMMCTLFKEVAELFGEMAGKYIDDDGQQSEVSV